LKAPPRAIEDPSSGAAAVAAHHEEGRAGLAARLRKSPKNAACHAFDDLCGQDSVAGSDDCGY
jgi:hypothetical protein